MFTLRETRESTIGQSGIHSNRDTTAGSGKADSPRGGSIRVTDEVAKTRYSDFSIRLCKLM